MASSDRSSNSYLVALLGEHPRFAKDEDPHRFRRHPDDLVIYEDDHVIVVDEAEHDNPGGSDVALWQKRLIIAPKKHIRSFLDLGVDDDRTAIHLLHAIQQVALAEDLQNHGFELSIDVLPPRQHSDLMKIKIRSGEKGKTGGDGSSM